MTQITLPNTNITGANLWSQVEDNDQAIADVVNGDIGTDNIQTGLLPPTGSILQYAGSAAPTGWLLCEGQAVSRTGTYATLFAAIGTAYGTGDGSTTFNLPDLRGRIPVGKGTHASVDALGDNDGTSTVANRRPAHNHTVTDPGHTHTVEVKTASNVLNNTFIAGSDSGTSANRSTSSATTGISVGSSGGTTDAPSFVVVNYIIKV